VPATADEGREVFEDQVLAGTKGVNQPTQQISEARDHGENLIELLLVEPVAKSLYLQMQDVLRTHRGHSGRLQPAVRLP